MLALCAVCEYRKERLAEECPSNPCRRLHIICRSKMRQHRWNYRQMPFATKANGVRIRAVSSKTHMANTWYNAAMTQDSSNTEALPDRLSIDPRSPHYNETLIARGVGIRFNGAEKTNIEEYC